MFETLSGFMEILPTYGMQGFYDLKKMPQNILISNKRTNNNVESFTHGMEIAKPKEEEKEI